MTEELIAQMSTNKVLVSILETLGSVKVPTLTFLDAANQDKELVIKSLLKYGSEKIILGADFLENTIKINGWITQTGIDLFDFISEFYDIGLRYVIATDISKDGVMKGPSHETYAKILKLFPNLKLIASDGISIEDDFQKLAKIGCYGAITGKAIYEKSINLKNTIIKYGS